MVLGYGLLILRLRLNQVFLLKRCQFYPRDIIVEQRGIQTSFLILGCTMGMIRIFI